MTKKNATSLLSTIISIFFIAACSAPKTAGTPTLPPTETAPAYTPTSSATLTPQPTAIPPTPTLEYPIGSKEIAAVDGMTMVVVPAGEFQMGSPDGVGQDNEHPQHTVNLGAYWIDQTEVTNGMYKKCVAAGACTVPVYLQSSTRNDYYSNPVYDNYPVVNLNYYQAALYCYAVGRQLPTEAEWEYAAKGPEGFLYPWGNEPPSENSNTLNMMGDDTTAVGSFPNGSSPFGALDMAGNVMEWVADTYGEYSPEAVTNPRMEPKVSPDEERVLRGGSWNNYIVSTTTYRSSDIPNGSYGLAGTYGFRCVQNFNQIKDTGSDFRIFTPGTCAVESPINGSLHDPLGQPIRNFGIEFYQLTYFGTNEPMGELVETVNTGEDGSFSFMPPRCGDYEMKFIGHLDDSQNAAPGGEFLVFFNGDLGFPKEKRWLQKLIVNAPLTTALMDITLEKATTKITGQLMDEQNKPVSAVSVIGIRMSDGLISVSPSVTDSTGYFSIPASPGTWGVLSLPVFIAYEGALPEEFSAIVKIVNNEGVEPIILHITESLAK